MSQLSYAIDQAVAFEGMLADNSDTKDVLSYNNKASLIYIGKVVSQGAGEDECIEPAAAADITSLLKVRGVAIHTHAIESKNDGLEANYSILSQVNVLHKGRVWVKFEDAPSVGVQPSVRYAGVGKKGAFVSTPVGGETAVLPNSKVLATATGNLALIEIDL